MPDLSLFDIEAGLHDLVTAWQKAPDAESQAKAEALIRAFVEAEVRKVDGLRKYVKACEAQAEAAKVESQAQARRATMWTARKDRIKAFVFDVMQSFNVKKLEGLTGSLQIKGNGGLQPLTISDPSLVPDELCVWQGEISAAAWEVLDQAMDDYPDLANGTRLVRTPNAAAIRAALNENRTVAGCSLSERGQHLEVK
jgi:hypothetical protein